MTTCWQMRCDQGHGWEVWRDDDAEPGVENMRCAVDGTPAITASRQPAADQAVPTLLPAARIVDSVTGALGHEKEYYLLLTDRHGVQRRRSSASYTWEEAVARAALFRGLTWAQAVQRWQRHRLS